MKNLIAIIKPKPCILLAKCFLLIKLIFISTVGILIFKHVAYKARNSLINNVQTIRNL